MEKTDQIKTAAYVTGNVMLQPGIYSLWLKQPQIAAAAAAGQFVALYCKDGSRLLPRPISICEIDREGGLLRLVYRVAGKGTEEFSKLRAGDTAEIMGPLGNGFRAAGKTALVFGGGIGIPPMLELAKQLSGTARVQAVLGYRDGKLFLADEFKPYAEVFLATEDGSLGTKGNVLDVLRQAGLSADMIYACGPLPMLRGIKEFAGEKGIPAQISMEERMACGIGACLACVCRTKETDAHSNVKNKRICKDGPVFDAQEVDLDEH